MITTLLITNIILFILGGIVFLVVIFNELYDNPKLQTKIMFDNNRYIITMSAFFFWWMWTIIALFVTIPRFIKKFIKKG